MLWTAGLTIVLIWFLTCFIGVITRSMKIRSNLLAVFITLSAVVLGYFWLSG